MLVVGDFESLLGGFSVVAWCFYALAVSCLLRLRVTRPLAPRPFQVRQVLTQVTKVTHVVSDKLTLIKTLISQVPLVVPVVFLAVCACLVCALVLLEPAQALVALGLVAVGLPLRYCSDRWCVIKGWL